jgi:hypothetical protein
VNLGTRSSSRGDLDPLAFILHLALLEAMAGSLSVAITAVLSGQIGRSAVNSR